jgi:hypothetical protein
MRRGLGTIASANERCVRHVVAHYPPLRVLADSSTSACKLSHFLNQVFYCRGQRPCSTGQVCPCVLCTDRNSERELWPTSLPFATM